ncbi:hypothetical protein H310_13105 [Aphanomyces invadans]|uniref:Nucleolar protein 14 n=1 Tax=Aphanomyces invadans TaxID=157072 RepID=A0A024TH25_9STRA|nr:hypothetical protein H310_13105 [Aphanomyces invadans]ETV92662.1 hypothetical protein H310_13105 [Aphanomyces invadans]|eukprot:XP_008878698.1 hypothetical protein H310_13105 [Aphanomyces invadans]
MGKKERQLAIGRTKKVAGKGVKASFGKGKGGNAFDVQKNSKSKYEVLGKRVKGQGRNVAAARADAEERRRKTLLKQFQGRKKNNEYKDRRLGEQNEDMSLEDKMIARFQTERKRQYQQRNAAKFNLNDDGESDREEELLTHRGAKIDDFDNIDIAGEASDDEEDRAFDHKLGRDIVNQLHFGGGDSKAVKDSATAAEGPERKKTHEEIMQEVMMKSKMYKAEKQKNKATQDETTEQLDAEFADFQSLLQFRPKKEDRPREMLDDFDKMTRELAMEAKAKATERKLSPEELAKKEHDKLAELERKRVARMNGEDEDAVDDDKVSKRKGRKDKKGGKRDEPELVLLPPKHLRASDDALVDDFQIQDEYRQRVEGENDEDEDGDDDCESGEDDDEVDDEEDDDDDEEDDDEEDDDNDDLKDDEEHNDDEVDDEEDEENEEDDDEQARAAALLKRQEAQKEMPFVFPCPESPAELTALFAQHGPTPADRNTIVTRIRTFYSPRVSAENQAKMKKFLAVLVRHFLKLAAHFKRNQQDADAIAAHIFTIAQDQPNVAGTVFREFVAALAKKLDKNCWPEMRDLLLLRVALSVFPITDLRHNVVSPIELVLGQCLSRATLESPDHVRRALFCVGLSLHITEKKSKFMPELVHCLHEILALVHSHDDDWFVAPLKAFVKSKSTDFPSLALHAGDQTDPAQVSAAIFHSTLTSIRLAATQYASLASFVELFASIHTLLSQLKAKMLKAHAESTVALLMEKMEASLKQRRPLRLQAHAPTVLPTFVPRFDENYAMRKDKTMERDRAQLKQLQRQVKRERKGASRELKRDAAFLSRQRAEEQKTWRAEKDAKQKEIRSWMEQQNATFNQQVRKGGELIKGGGSGPAKKRRISKK